ncbi:hypothetical protein CISIN_1g034754mg [Citrus sinensis]|uniref:Uncharacterized protein n=1 Tax=Citrus sinensis TaxID=2711 RepID=A0A067GEM7_CITSI|nr:hypothetical protein CISIN_1g034754mg [Citrus sinensis]
MSSSPTLFLWKLQNFYSASDSSLPKVTALENLIKIWQPFAIPSLLFINLVSFGQDSGILFKLKDLFCTSKDIHFSFPHLIWVLNA